MQYLWKIPMTYFRGLGKALKEAIWKKEAIWNHKKYEQSKNNAGGIIRPNVKLYHRVKVIKKAWYCHENMKVDQ